MVRTAQRLAQTADARRQRLAEHDLRIAHAFRVVEHVVWGRALTDADQAAQDHLDRCPSDQPDELDWRQHQAAQFYRQEWPRWRASNACLQPAAPAVHRYANCAELRRVLRVQIRIGNWQRRRTFRALARQLQALPDDEFRFPFGTTLPVQVKLEWDLGPRGEP